MLTFWQCTVCRFRFPAGPHDLVELACPDCGGVIDVVGEIEESAAVSSAINAHPPQRDIVAILDNIRSASNVGAMLRTSDGAGVKHVYLCGMTAPADHRKVVKTALDAEKSVPSSHYLNVMDAVEIVQEQGYEIWAIEGGEDAVGLFDVPLVDKIALVMGNEKAGVDPELLAIADRVVSIPMRGIKRSLNVAVAFGITAYHLTDGS